MENIAVGLDEQGSEGYASDSLPLGVSSFRIAVSDAVLAHIRERVSHYPWPTTGPTTGTTDTWEYGANLAFLRRLADYWLQRYDWRSHEARMNASPGYAVEIEGSRLFFFWQRPLHPTKTALLILPGWPYSCASYLNVAHRLSHPEAYGGNAADGVHVVIPSFPGYSFSEPSPVPLGPRELGERMNALMKQLGFRRYLVHGGDIGANAASWMAYDHPENVIALSSTFVIVRQQDAAMDQPAAERTALLRNWPGSERNRLRLKQRPPMRFCSRRSPSASE